MSRTIGQTYDDVKCGECTRPMILRQSRGGLFYGCPLFSCKATVPAYREDTPVGTPPNLATMAARRKALEAFSALWEHYPKREHKNRRDHAYAWLAEVLEIPVAACHIMQMDIAQCERVIEVCTRRVTREKLARVEVGA